MAGSQLRPDRLALEVVDLDAIARQVCQSMASVHEEATIRCLPPTAADARKRVLVPPVAFTQALINLVDNARRVGRTPERGRGRGRSARACVPSSRSRTTARAGPRSCARHLGEPFVTTKPEGVGLGLYYVHSLSEAIGARARPSPTGSSAGRWRASRCRSSRSRRRARPGPRPSRGRNGARRMADRSHPGTATAIARS